MLTTWFVNWILLTTGLLFISERSTCAEIQASSEYASATFPYNTIKEESCGYNRTVSKEEISQNTIGAIFGNITSPNYPNPYHHNTECFWKVSFPVDYVLIVDVITLNVESCCDLLTVINGNFLQHISLTQTYILEKEEAIFHFKSDIGINNKGFLLQYTVVEENVTVAEEMSGGSSEDGFFPSCKNLTVEMPEIGDTEVLSSPDWPKDYPRNLDCSLRIVGHPESIILAHVLSFTTETCCDQLMFGNESGAVVQTLAGYVRPGTQFFSSSNTLLIGFVTDGNEQRSGFSIKFTAIDPSQKEEYENLNQTSLPDNPPQSSCGGEVNATNDYQYITSPGYPLQYPPHERCIWMIVAPPGLFLELSAEFVQVELCCDFLQLSEPDSARRNIPTGMLYVTSGNKLQVNFTSDQSIQRRGFRLKYRSVNETQVRPDKCGFKEHFALDGVDKHLVSPNYPEHYDNSLQCVYTFKAPDKNYRIRFRLEFFHTEICCDKLNFYDSKSDFSSGTPGVSISGPGEEVLTIYSNTSVVTVQFISDLSVNYRGFDIVYTAVESSDVPTTPVNAWTPPPSAIPTHNELCGTAESATDVAQYLRSPNYPQPYPNYLTCTWDIYADEDYGIVMQFGKSSTESCCDKVEILEGRTRDVFPSIFSGNFTSTTFMSNSSYVQVRFTTDFGTTDVGFEVSYQIISRDLIPTEPRIPDIEFPTTSTIKTTSQQTLFTNNTVSCGFSAEVTNVNQVVTSPGWPDQYGDNLNCEWVLTAREHYHVQLTFESFSSELCCDYVIIDDGELATPRLNNKNVMVLSPFFSKSNVLKLRFQTDSSVAEAGFQATFIEIDTIPEPLIPNIGACGFNDEATDVSLPLYSPNWPHYYLGEKDCFWTIQAPSERRIAITFQSFNTEKCCDYLKVSDDEGDIADLRGDLVVPVTYWTTKGPLRLHFHSDLSFERPGFEAFYMLTESSTTAPKRRLRCYTGLKLSGIGLDRESRALTECPPDSACWDVSAKVITSILGSSVETRMTTAQCVPRAACQSYSCAQIQIPPEAQTEIQSCTTRCCTTDMCNLGLDELKDDDDNDDNDNDNNDVNIGDNESDGTFSISTTTMTSYDGTKPEKVTASNVTTMEPEIIQSSTTFLSAISAVSNVSITVAPCGFNATSTATSQDLYSPGWPGQYTANLSCEWTLTASHGKQVQLQFISLYTEDCCDYITITDVGGQHVDDFRGNSFPSTSILSSHGVLHLRFVSDRSVQRSGFHIRFLDSDIKGISPAPCGFDKAATYAPQNLFSPGFPQVYRNSIRCEWRITAPQGKTINLNFTYFDTENCCDYLVIYDYGKEISDIRGRNLPARTISSESNQLILRFVSDSSIPATGFQSTFQIAGEGFDVTTTEAPVVHVDPHKVVVTTPVSSSTRTPSAPCGFIRQAHDFAQHLNSPGWPGNYPESMQCEWRLTASEGKQVQLDFKFVELEECCDTVQIFDSSALLGPVKKVFGTQFKSTTGTLLVRFKSDGTVQKKGFQSVFRETDSLEIGPAPCGFIAIAKSGKQPLNSPGWPGHYADNLACTWTLQARPGKQVSLEFTSINVEECCDLVKILENGNEVISLKGETLPETPYIVTSKTGSLTVRFTSDFSVSKPGFEALFYDLNIPLPTKVITLQNQSEAHVSCGHDAIAREYFQILTSPNHPQEYEGNLTCTWRIVAPDDNAYVTIRMEYIDTELCCDYLLIYDGTTRVARVGGSRLTLNEFTSQQNLIVITFVSDTNVHGTGFRLSYKLSKTPGAGLTTLPPTTTTPTIQCGYNQTLRAGEIATFESPGWPAAYWSNALCLWKFSAPIGSIMQINFTTFDTEQCCDYLLIQEPGLAQTRLDGVFIRNTVRRTTTNEVVLSFKSDGSVARAGFEGVITAAIKALVVKVLIHSASALPRKGDASEFPKSTEQTTTSEKTASTTPELETQVRCSNTVIATDEWKSIASEGWPLQYPLNYQCAWTIESSREDVKIRIKFLEVDLCCDDVLTVYDGEKIVDAPITPKILENPLNIPRFYVSTSNRIHVKLKTSGPRAATGFQLKYKIDALSVLPCGSVTYLADPSILQTPNFPSNYPDDLSCAWTLDAPFGSQVVLNVTSLDTEGCCDYLQITDGPDHRLIETRKGSIQENLIFRSSTNLMTVTFYSDASETRSGFQATVEAKHFVDHAPDACGFTAVATDRDTFLYSTNYPNEYPPGKDCYWLIRSPFPNRQIELRIHDFKSEDCCDFLKIYDGTNINSPELGNIRGISQQPFFQSTTSSLFVHFRSDTTVNYRGFNASFSLVADQISTTQDTLVSASSISSEGRECQVGTQITRSEVNADSKVWTRCKKSESCFRISATVSASHNGSIASVELSVGQCVRSDQCEKYRCSTIQSYVPTHISAVRIHGCKKDCCNAEGFCTGSASTEDVVIDPETSGKNLKGGVECRVGAKLIGNGISQDNQRLTRCGSDEVCSRLSTGLTATVDGSQLSVDVSLRQCVSSEQCYALGCNQLLKHLPPSFRGSMTGCNTECCRADGSCSASSLAFDASETVQVNGTAAREGHKCKVGAKITGSGINQDYQLVTRCNSNEVCSELSSSATANIGGLPASIEITLHLCVLPEQCDTLGCDPLQRLLPQDFPGRMTGCVAECCYSDGSCSLSTFDFDDKSGNETGIFKGVECRVGAKLAGDFISQDHQQLIRCDSGQVCSHLSTHLTTNAQGTPSLVDVSLGQCVSSEQCPSLRCDELESHLPSILRGSMTGCNTQCCRADGLCVASSLAIGSQSGGNAGVDTAAQEGRVECRVGGKISTDGFGYDQDNQRLTRCNSSQVCSRLSTSFSTNLEGFVVPVDTSLGQCVSSEQCGALRCGELESHLPSILRGSMTGCNTECCRADGSCVASSLANGGQTGGNAGVDTTENNGVKCRVGAKITGNGFNQANQQLTRCNSNQVCSHLAAYLTTNVDAPVVVSLRQCVSSEQCRAFECDELESHLPPILRGSMTGCNIECCRADGSCVASSLAIGSQSGGNAVGDTAEEDRVECRVGARISTGGFGYDQDNQQLTRCNSSQICSHVSTSFTRNLEGFLVPVDVSLRQCVSSEQCRALGCDELESQLPSILRGSMTGCITQCCRTEGSCDASSLAIGSQTGGNAGVDTAAKEGRVECRVGGKISTDGFGYDQDNQQLTRCNSSQVCSRLSTSFSTNLEGFVIPVDTSLGQCVSSEQCGALECDELESQLPSILHGSMTGCSIECCRADGSCDASSLAIGGQTGGNAGVDTTENNGVKCRVGAKITGNGFNQDNQQLTRCNSNQVCSHLAAYLTTNVDAPVVVSLRQCVSSEQCRAFECDELESHLPPILRGSMTGCSTECCRADGSCVASSLAIGSQSGGNAVGDTAEEDGVECRVGAKISTGGFGYDQDNQQLTRCNSSQICSHVSTSFTRNLEGFLVPVDVSLRQCVSSEQCRDLGCDELESQLPSILRGSMTGCNTECCRAEGSCDASSLAIGSQTGGNAGVEIVGNGLRCYVGTYISSHGITQNSQVVHTCKSEETCLHVKISLYNNFTASPAEVSVGQCVPRLSCHLVTCERIRSFIPSLSGQLILSCQSRCCNEDLCNSPVVAIQEHASEISSSQDLSEGETNTGFIITADKAKPKETECLSKDVAYLPGCTYKEYYAQYTLCSTLFYNDYPYEDITACGTSIQLFQSCLTGLKKRCLAGNKTSILGQNSSQNSEVMEQLVNAMSNSTLVLEPVYEVLCEKDSDKANFLTSGLASFVSALSIIPKMCDSDRLEAIVQPLSEAAQDLIYANKPIDMCRAYDGIKTVLLELLDACDFSNVQTSFVLSNWITKLEEILPELINSFNLPKCMALQEIEEVRPSEPILVTPAVFSTPDEQGCWFYNMDIMFLLDGSGSIRKGEFSQVINFMKEVVASLDLKTNKVGVMQYSHWYNGRDWTRQRYMQTAIPLGQYTNRILFEQAADRIVHHGYTTYTAHAIQKAVSIDLTASDRYLSNCTHQVIVVVTDGKSTDSSELLAASNLGRRTGVTLFAVGVRGYRLAELQIIANGQEGNNERVYTASNFFDLIGIAPILKADLEEIISSVETDVTQAP